MGPLRSPSSFMGSRFGPSLSPVNAAAASEVLKRPISQIAAHALLSSKLEEFCFSSPSNRKLSRPSSAAIFRPRSAGRLRPASAVSRAMGVRCEMTEEQFRRYQVRVDNGSSPSSSSCPSLPLLPSKSEKPTIDGSVTPANWSEQTLDGLQQTPKSSAMVLVDPASQMEERPSWPFKTAEFSLNFDRQLSEELPSEIDAWLSSTMLSLDKPRTPVKLKPLPQVEVIEAKTRTDSLDLLNAGSYVAMSLVSDAPGPEPTERETLRPEDDVVLDAAALAELELKKLRHLERILPNAGQVLERLRGGSVGFSDSELDRLTKAFQRFKMIDGSDIHKDDLHRVLYHLGYTQLPEEQIAKTAHAITRDSSMELDLFLLFIQEIAKLELEKFKQTFSRFDRDGDGALNEHELSKYLSSLGFTPLRRMVKEAMSMVDLDGNGELDLEETVLLMSVYRQSEGFTHEEITLMIEKFNQLRDDDTEEMKPKNATSRLQIEVPASKLRDILVKFFGPASAVMATEIAEEAVAHSCTKGGTVKIGSTGIEGSMHFSEILTWARCLRDKSFETYRSIFDKYDEDESGYIDQRELKSVIKALGFTLTEATLSEAMEEVWKRDNYKSDKDGNLDFDGFVHLMEHFRDTDGFSKKEIEDIRLCFEKFDEDLSGDIDVVELSDVLQHMGHATKLESVMDMVRQVDYNGNGTLDFREFLRMMRLHREDELVEVREVFGKFSNRNGRISTAKIVESLSALSFTDKEFDVIKLTTGRDVDFDAFVHVVDRIRDARRIEMRRKAGFTDDELRRFKDLFDDHDKSKTGMLDTAAVSKLLDLLGTPVRTSEEQHVVRLQLENARIAVHGTSTGPVDFWVVVQLLRGLSRRDDKQVLDKVVRAAEQSRFSMAEVNEFRDVFMTAWQSARVYEAEEGGHSHAEPLDRDVDIAKRELSRASLRRLLRTLGLKLDAAQRTALDEQVTKISKRQNIDLPEFLEIMRWMMDSNFANICGAASK